MSWLSDVTKVVEDVVRNPAPVVIGGVGLGPVGTAIGVAVADGQVKAQEQTAEALEEYRQKIDQAISDLKAAKPDYVQLEVLWVKFTTEGLMAAYKDRYGAACPPQETLAPMITVDLNDRRKALTPEEFKTQLDDIHNGSVEASTQQLQYERDNPQSQNQPTSSEVLNKFFSDLFNALAHWLAARFTSNFEGAGNESGFGAKVLRGGLGISWEDIKARGLLGGDNSYLRQIVPTWSDNGGIFGGENSFFRKPFG
jgi:hypothetical protein